MAKHQTAVQWLIEELGEYFPHEIGGIHLMVEKAKQMEKDQIEMAHYHNRCIDDQSYDCSMKAFYDAQEYYIYNYVN